MTAAPGLTALTWASGICATAQTFLSELIRKSGAPASERRAFAHAEFGDDPVCRRIESRGRRRLALGFEPTNGAFRNAQHEEALPRRCANLSSARRSRIEQRDVFLLSCEPRRRNDIDERLAAANGRQCGFHMQARDIAVHTRLHDFEQLLVERDRTDRRKPRLDGDALDLSKAYSEILRGAGAHLDLRPIVRVVGVHRHELHIHVGRLSGLVELDVRHHRIVPIENLATTSVRRRRVVCEPPADAVTQGSAHEQHGDEGRNESFHDLFLSAARRC